MTDNIKYKYRCYSVGSPEIGRRGHIIIIIIIIIIITYLLTYLLTPWSRVLLGKLNRSAASQEIPRIFGTRRFITVLTSARHLGIIIIYK